MGPYLAAAACGLLLLPVLPSLPPLWLAPLAAIIFLFCARCWRRRNAVLLALFFATFSWSVATARHAVDSRIPAVWEGVELEATGLVSGLPEAVERGVRLRFWPEQAAGPQGESVPVAGLWQLFSPLPDMPLPDAVCTLRVKLKRPHGVVNPGGFDYEAWLLSEGVTASGTVRTMQCVPPEGITIDGLRGRLREHFLVTYPERPAAGVVLALITGDRTQVVDELWERYVATGVVHLMAISGLHITLLAVVTAWQVRRLLSFFPLLALRCPLHKPALAAGFVVAWLYSLMAGYSVPTERTLIMLAVVLLCQGMNLRLPAFQILMLALVVVLLWSPLAVHAVGFWLSFGAVAILLLLGTLRQDMPAWRQALTLQFVLTLLLLPLTLWFFERASWVSPLANLLAVPVVTFVIVPLGLSGLLFWLLPSGGIAHVLWSAAIFLMTTLDALLEQFQGWPGAGAPWSLAGAGGLLWLILGVLLLWQPVQRQLFLLLPVFALALLLPPLSPQPGVLRMTVLDVGQGLSVLLQTRQHRLLYDTGPPLGPVADAGQRYVLPSLRRLGVYKLDRLLLSHDDNDHTGGAASVLVSMPVKEGMGALPTGLATSYGNGWQECRAGQEWSWEGWRFAILYPDDEEFGLAGGDNNRSCVLHVSRGDRGILLPGDLEQRGERRLLARLDPGRLRADVLVLGHHGSRNASSLEWVAAISPSWAIASAGYRNAFRHPSQTLLDRLQHTGVRWRNTAASGALVIELSEVGVSPPSAWRQTEPRYWRERQDDEAQAFFEN